ncbi:signal peptidase II [Psychromonas sp.]|uniref:signal peptidase II n=1 Tax=Psychromonas sp. TaxID=1884585 RepID=UPI0039E6A1AE
MALLLYLVTNSRQHRLSLITLSLVFAGGISNFYDRVVNNVLYLLKPKNSLSILL